MNSEIQFKLFHFPGLEKEHQEAVAMMCSFYELFPKIFQGRNNPYKTPDTKKDPRRLHLFKCCLKSIQELKKKNGPDPRVWVIAQLKTLRAIEGDVPVIISGSSLYGEKAWARWFIYEKHAKKQVNQIAQTSTVKIKPLVDKIQLTHEAVKENLESWLLNGKIRMLARENKISKIYLSLHPKVVEFAKKYTWNAVGFDPITVPGLDNKEIIDKFKEITGITPVGPNLKG